MWPAISIWLTAFYDRIVTEMTSFPWDSDRNKKAVLYMREAIVGPKDSADLARSSLNPPEEKPNSRRKIAETCAPEPARIKMENTQ